MHDRRRYKVTDYRFGQLALTLREKARLTQADVAGAVGVSDRTIQHWEGGTAFPAAANLQKLIALYFQHGAFTPGHERDEAEAIWKQADESAARRKSLFDQAWFDRLLARHGDGDTVGVRAAVSALTDQESLHNTDWGEAPDASVVYGRERELATLQQWVLKDRCRVVLLLGIGGIGKTTLATRFAQNVASHFDFVVWRSLRYAPSLQDLLADCISALTEDQLPPILQSVEHAIKLLVDRLRARRCLLVLDDVESLFEAGSLAGGYRPEHGGYRLLFQRLGETQHQSCVLLTSREMLRELEPMEGKHAPVRALQVRGLDRSASQQLLEDRDLFGTPEDWDDLVQHYAGNPLALKIVAATVRDLFGGDLAASIAAYKRASVTNDLTIEQVLADQFQRLSSEEQTVLRWLAIEREPVGLDELRSDLAGAPPAMVDLLTSLRSLLRRSLVERSERGAIFTLQPEVLEYVTRQLVTEVCAALTDFDLKPITSYALMKGQSEDYVRDSQRRSILQQVLDAFLATAGSVRRVEERVLHLLETLRKETDAAQGYAAGNLVNLLVALRGHLRGVDCSDLVLRQAYLRGVDARDANLARSSAGETVFTEPLETIVAATLSPDGQYMALGSFTGQVRVRRVLDGKPLWTGQSGTRMAWALAFSNDATLLASGDYQGRVRLWSAAVGECVKTFEGHDKWVRTVAFSPDGGLLASGGDDETVRIWDVTQQGPDGACRHVLRGHTGLVWSLAFSPDGGSLISGSSDGTVCLWDVHSGRCVRVLQTHAFGIYSVAFHPSGAICASGSEDGLITVWDAQNGCCLGVVARQGTGPASIAFNPEGTLLVSGSNEGMVEVWEVSGEQDIRSVKALLGHSRLVNSVSFATGGLLATSSYGGQAKLWEVESGRRLRTIEGHSTLITSIAFSPDGSLLAQGDDNGHVYVWDVRSGQRLVAVEGHPGPVWAVAFSPDGERVISGGDDTEVKVWQARTGRCLTAFPGHATVVWSVAVSPDGTWVATGGADRVVKLWRLGGEAQERPSKTLHGSSHWIWSLAFAPEGTLLASGHTYGGVELWEVESEQRVQSMQHGDEPIGALCFSKDGNMLLTSSNQSVLKRWSVESGECLTTVPADNFGNWIKAVTIDPAGTLLISGGDNQRLLLWQIAPEDAGYPVASYVGHSGAVWAVALSADGTTLASSDDKGMTILWHRASGSVIGRLSSDRPYERMNIYGIRDLNDAQIGALRDLGAIEDEDASVPAEQAVNGRPALVLLDSDQVDEPPARQSI